MEEMQIEVGMIFVDAVLHKRYRIIAVTGNNITFCRMDCTQLEITAWSVNHLRKVLNQGGGELQTDEQNCVVDREKLSPTFQQTFSKREAAVREVEACFGPT